MARTFLYAYLTTKKFNLLDAALWLKCVSLIIIIFFFGVTAVYPSNRLQYLELLP